MRMRILISAALCAAIGFGRAALSGETNTHAAHKAPAAAAQTKCPVLGGDIDRSLHVDYRGRRVYFCCRQCIGEFNKNPQELVRKLR